MNSVAFLSASAAAETAPPNPKLQSAAHEFEASLMKEFLKPLQHDSLFAEEGDKGDDDDGGSAGALMSYGSEAMAKALSEQGGFGIAKKILEHFHASEKGTRTEGHAGSVRF
jgi:Rod binding domain-containing protein